jgi:UDP-N-acetyl-D-mannosaminuronate dehydrogenase
VPKPPKVPKHVSEARSREIAFDSGASSMVSTALQMISMVKDSGRLTVSDSANIVEATRKFTKPILTRQEVKFYEDISSAQNKRKCPTID